MNFSEVLRKTRKEQGISQKELAAKLGVSQPSYAQYENGKRNPKMETIYKIADALEVPVSVLCTDEKDTTLIIDMFSSTSNKIPEKYYKTLYKSPRNSDRTKFKCLQTIDNLLDQLNSKGQNKAMEQVEMLTKIPEYQKTEETKKTSEDSNILIAAHARTDIEVTEEMKQHDLDIMDDDNWE